MKNAYFIVFVIVFTALFVFSGCAKRGTISGGPKDTIPPHIISAVPNNYTTNFTGNEIKITFNELVKVKDINKQLIISPPLKNKPIIIPQGSASKFIAIKINDTLQPNTTYSFNFGQSIADNNEGNPYSQFKYVLSTGSYIDSLTVAGKIKDAFKQKPDNFVSIQLYDAKTFTDSTVYKEQPLYVTNTLDSLTVFAIENIKAGDYYLIALKDQNSNYKFDPKQDKIGFLKNKISIPNDTVFGLELFKEKIPFKAHKPIQQSNNKLFMGFEGNPKEVKISATDGKNNVPVITTIFPEKNKDSLQLFIPIIKADSLVISVEKDSFNKTFVTKIKAQKQTDSLQLQPEQKGSLSFRDTLSIKTSVPIKTINTEFITLLNKDSLAVSYQYQYNEFQQRILFDFKKEENQNYSLSVLPNAIEDIYGNKNDTLALRYSTKEYSNYGNLRVVLKSAKRFPLILEVLTAKGEVKARAISTGERILNFDVIDPNIYTLRIIYDDNGNGIWDTGNYLEKRQPEEIEYYPKEIDVRANWDVEQDF
ncbi:Ig-like domain-containing protein [Flavobacterium sp.]|uniref:Ig-like domain-containing protein n=1 Tax=Flavobacterium sp. TaxID=239 RepID=UPI003526E7C4